MTLIDETLSSDQGARSFVSAAVEIAVGSTVLGAGDQVLAILQPGKEDELRRALDVLVESQSRVYLVGV